MAVEAAGGCCAQLPALATGPASPPAGWLPTQLAGNRADTNCSHDVSGYAVECLRSQHHDFGMILAAHVWEALRAIVAS